MPSSHEQIQLIRECLHARLAATAGQHWLKENAQPANDPHCDYLVVHEVVVEPSALDKLRIEFWVTDDGAVGVGLENRGRFAKIAGAMTSAPSTFIAGHEPMRVSADYVKQLIDLAAYGAIDGLARAALGRLTWARLQVRAGQSLPHPLPQLPRSLSVFMPFGRRFAVHYRPW